MSSQLGVFDVAGFLSKMKLSWKIATCAVVTLIVVISGISIYMYQATRHVPEFYTAALKIEPAAAQETGEILEEQVFAFSNEIRKPSRWQLRLTNDQINGWLASDLEEKFPKLLPSGMHDPRISIQERQVKLGCRFEGQQFHSVMSLAIDAYLVEDEENVVAIQIRNVAAGSLPFPLGSLLDEVARRAEEAKIPLRWQQVDGDPVALVTVPSEGDQIEGIIRIDTLELRDGEIFLAGETLKAPEAAVEPAAPVAPEADADQEIKTASRPLNTLP